MSASHTRTRCGLIAAMIAMLVIGGVAIADSVVVTDPERDVVGPTDGPKRNFDFIEGTAGHAGAGVLKHTATVRGRIDRLPVLNIYTNDDDLECEYEVGRFGPKPKRIRVVSCETGARSRASADVNGDRVRYKFESVKIGSPFDYEWDFRFRRSGTTIDIVPDGGASHCEATKRSKRFCF